MATMMNGKQIVSLLLLLVLVVYAAGPVLAEESQGVMERVETTAKRVGQKIEDKTKAVVKKVEEKHIGDKIEQKLKKAANKTAEGFEKAGKKIEQKLGN
jgi:predicted PurR-regulated permease PerM